METYYESPTAVFLEDSGQHKFNISLRSCADSGDGPREKRELDNVFVGDLTHQFACLHHHGNMGGVSSHLCCYH